MTPADAACPPEFLALATGGAPRPVAFVRAVGSPILETARDALAAGLAVPILVGETARIEQDAAAIGWDLAGASIIDAVGEQAAIDAAVAEVGAGRAHGLIKGQLHTDIFMGTIVRRASGIRTDRRLVHIFAMLPPGGGRPLLISDAAVNIAPDVATRTEAALAMAALLRRMGVERPRIAVLSATESQLPGMPSSLEAAEIAAAATDADDSAAFAGPLSFDLALSPESAAIKGITPDSDSGAVAGYADGLIVPDIVSGNVLFKALAYCAGGLAAGVVLGGRVPIMLTSRSDPAAARLASLALAAIAVQEDH
ncbi:MAG: phosphate acetyltransferase [SAR116 cluster bacterium]|nr:phosphate acetyltransferase [SAR116 cluster bacterium]RPG98312.1 MAG: phosphate acetyltransferase [Candidatus Puniceispirillum sp. TMED176]